MRSSWLVSRIDTRATRFPFKRGKQPSRVSPWSRRAVWGTLATAPLSSSRFHAVNIRPQLDTTGIVTLAQTDLLPTELSMGIESQGPCRPVGSLTPRQIKTFQKVEPKALGSIQIIIAVLCLCLSITILQLYEEIHFSPDVIVVVVIVVQLLVSGSILIHAGRFPSLFWVKGTLVSHLVSAAFSTAVMGLLSRHLPYRQDTYHCEHCRRLEIFAVHLIDGFLATLVLFLVVELAICIVTILYGLSALAKGGMQLPGFRQRAAPPQPETVTPSQPQVEVLVTDVEPVPVPVPVPIPQPDPEAKYEPIEELPSPPTEPQVAPIDSLTDF
ncbi:hypothetical protein DNTS_023848 [Danionella cerebrum]|uniref:Uncharacterized protein n=1 Tax=Danionella cerebrum TaxID=2873325 RepID=A0A553QSX1_9TELE|nr:hypothetical protein DNTS_023848 [Danionella translucida]